MFATRRIPRILSVVTATCIALAGAGASADVGAPVQRLTRTSASTLEAVPSTITYQGRLLDGAVPAEGVYDYRFSLWDQLAAGTQIGAAIVRSDVAVADGLVTLDLDVPRGTFHGEAVWLQIEVKRDADADFELLSPREPLTAVPYAHGLVPGAVIDDTDPGGYGIEVRSGGGIAVLAKSGTVPMILPIGKNALYGMGEENGVVGRGYGAAGTYGGTFSGYGGVLGTGGLDAGVTGISDESHGVYGRTDSDQPTRAGVHGYSRTGGTGVVGMADGPGGTGVKGAGSIGVRGSGSTGVSGEGDVGVLGTSSIGPGVKGEHTGAIAGPAVVGTTTTMGGTGVDGRADFGTGVYGLGETGVMGKSSVGPGVVGEGAVGVSGSSTVGRGVYGASSYSRGVGVYGTVSSAEGTPYGIYGDSDHANGYAGYFDGRVQVTGRFDSPDKHFRIDDPLDPANRYLVHSSVESPDRLNVYDGNVVTDAAGTATVVLPAYFEALNGDFRYQLTVIGEFAQAIVASEIRDNRFVIRTDKPRVKVSWQVTGVRRDPYARAHPVNVVELKPPAERGLYLHPVENGQPPEKGIDYRREMAWATASLGAATSERGSSVETAADGRAR